MAPSFLPLSISIVFSAAGAKSFWGFGAPVQRANLAAVSIPLVTRTFHTTSSLTRLKECDWETDFCNRLTLLTISVRVFIRNCTLRRDAL